MLAHISSLVALALIVSFADATPASPSLSIPIPSDSAISSVSGISSSATSDIPSASDILSSATDIPSAASGILSFAVTSLSSSVSGILSSVTDIPSSISVIAASVSEGSGSLTPNPSIPTSSFSTSTFSSSCVPLPTGIPSAMCDKADLQCCAVARPEGDSQVTELLDAFEIDEPGNRNALVGVFCTNMTTGITERDDYLCTGDTLKPLCCSDNSHDGVVALDCVPISQSTT